MRRGHFMPVCLLSNVLFTDNPVYFYKFVSSKPGQLYRELWLSRWAELMVLMGGKCTACIHSYAPALFSFDSFWSSPMCSIYLRKLKIHKNVICLKSLKVGFSSTWTKNFQIYKMGFKEAEEPEIKLLTSNGSWRKQGSARKTSTSAPLTMLKFLTM